MSKIVWITPKIAVSGRQQLSDAPHMAQTGITAVLNLTIRPDPKWTFQTHNDGTPDDGQPKSAAWFRDGINFVLNALPHGKVLIHCEAGVNRGPSMAYAVLRSQGRSISDATELVTRKCGVKSIRYAADYERTRGN